MSKFYPDLQIDSFKELNLQKLKEQGIECILLDIDNTLARYCDVYPDSVVIEFVNEIRKVGFKVAFVSNNSKERVTKFAKDLDVDTIYRANKPLKRGFLRAVSILGVAPKKTAVVGDQIFTDIYGGNRCGMYTILVLPLESNENIFFKTKRFFEKILLKSMQEKMQKKGNNK